MKSSLKFYLLFSIFVLLFVLGIAFLHPRSPQQTPVPSSVPTTVLGSAKTVFDDINEFRISKNLNPLKWTNNLCDFAEVRVIQVQTDFSHTQFYGESKYHYYCPNCSAMGENLARRYDANQAVVDAWIHSPTHLAILLDQWTDGCVAFNPKGEYTVLEVSR